MEERIDIEGDVTLTQKFFKYNQYTKKFDAKFKFGTVQGNSLMTL